MLPPMPNKIHCEISSATFTFVLSTELNDLILEPLRNLFVCSSIFFKCQLVYCFTELLRNYVILELPRYQDSVAIQKVQKSAAVQSGDADITVTG